MSNIELVIEERATDIGNFMVGRLLPFRRKRSVGPFVFIDHMGPVALNENENMDVPPHPHIGLSTLTYLFDGAIVHRDSIGNNIEIRPGAVNWMTAGKGVVHSERTPDRLRGVKKVLHGLQIWVALPKHLETCDPTFFHISKDEIPAWTEGGLEFKLIAGAAFGKQSAVPVHSSLYFIEIKSSSGTVVDLSNRLYGESALYILEGNVFASGEKFGSKQILIAKNTDLCSFEIGENTTLYIFGGEPFDEERYIDWNFVSSDKQLIEDAKRSWEEQKFPVIEGETEFVPYPKRRI